MSQSSSPSAEVGNRPTVASWKVQPENEQEEDSEKEQRKQEKEGEGEERGGGGEGGGKGIAAHTREPTSC